MEMETTAATGATLLDVSSSVKLVNASMLAAVLDTTCPGSFVEISQNRLSAKYVGKGTQQHNVGVSLMRALWFVSVWRGEGVVCLCLYSP